MLNQAVKAIVHKSLFAFSLLLVLSASASAQTATERTVFDIPFQFTAGGKRLPAGEYTIQRVSQTGQVYLIKSRDGSEVAAVSVNNIRRAGRRSGEPRLTFNAYGEQYFLSQVRPSSSGVDAMFRRSRAEREAAQATTDSRVVTVVAARE